MTTDCRKADRYIAAIDRLCYLLWLLRGQTQPSACVAVACVVLSVLTSIFIARRRAVHADAEHDIVMAFLSVRVLPVCPSHAGIVSK